jgi:hypothetical protein
MRPENIYRESMSNVSYLFKPGHDPMLLHRLILSEPKMNEGKGIERDVQVVQVMTPKLMALGYPVVPHTA